MRKLSAKLKVILNQSYKETDCISIDEIDNDTYEKLVSLNDYETLYQDANRYLSDLHFDQKPWHSL